MPKLPWKAFETAVADSAFQTVKTTMEEWPDESFYAVAFHEFYREELGIISMPCLAVNTEEELTDEDCRWSSADWYWIDLEYSTREIDALYSRILGDATSQEVDHWCEVNERFVQAFINIAKSLTKRLKKLKPTSKDFSVLVFDDDRDDAVELIRACLTAAQFRKFFPRLEEERQAKKAQAQRPVEEKLKVYQQDIYEYQDEILILGDAAISMLLEELVHDETGWCAADLLGYLGISDRKVITALRKQARKSGDSRFHETGALVLLGDVDFVLNLADQKETREDAIRGILTLYGPFTDHCVKRIPLDYGPFERLLEKPECRRKVQRPSGQEITVDDLDEAIRGTKSKHAVIRQHAVCVLGENRLGKKAGERVLPVLADCLKDKSAEVRRLAIINLYYWKKAAQPYLTDIRRLIKDSDADVRSTARHYAKAIADGDFY